VKIELRWCIRQWPGDTITLPLGIGLFAVMQSRTYTDDAGWSEWTDLPVAKCLT